MEESRFVQFPEKKINPKIQKDGKGGAIITWQDNRVGNYDIYAQRISKNGVLRWNPNGIVVCNSLNTQSNPKIDPSNSSGGAYITWADKRNNLDYDIFVQKIDSNGLILFAANGIAVCTITGSQSAPEILSNNVNGVIICWKDAGAGNQDIYAQRVSASGTAMWSNNGVAICSSSNDQINPNMCEDDFGGAIVCWQDSSSTDYNIKAQRINDNGEVQWATNGIDIGTAAGIQKSPKNIIDGAGGSIFVWQDKRGSGFDIYAHHIYNNGTYVNTASLEHENDSEISIFPNPSSFDFSISGIIWNTLEVVDAFGRTVMVVQNNAPTVDISNLSNGIYSIHINSKDNKMFTKRLEILK